MMLKIILCLILMVMTPLQAQVEETSNKVEIQKIVKGVLFFFSVFSDSRGCVTGKVANYTMKKLIDPLLETKSLCLTKTNRDNFTISWQLINTDDYVSVKTKIIFKQNGHLKITIENKILEVAILGLKYRFLKGGIFRIKLLNFNQNEQQLSIKSLGTFLPIKLTSNIQYFLENFRFQFIHILGLKFKLKKKQV